MALHCANGQTLAQVGEQGRASHKILDRASAFLKYDWGGVVRRFAFWLGVYSSQLQLVPHQLHELVDVPVVFGTDGTGVGDAV